MGRTPSLGLLKCYRMTYNGMPIAAVHKECMDQGIQVGTLKNAKRGYEKWAVVERALLA